MLNNIQMQLKRMVKTKSFWWTILAFVILLGVCFYTQIPAQEKMNFPKYTDSFNEIGLYTQVDFYLNTPLQFVKMFAIKIGALVFGIFYITFVCSERSSGFIRHSVMMNKRRYPIIISKVIVGFVLALIMLLIAYLVSFVAGTLWITGFGFGSLESNLIFCSTLVVVMLALFSFLMMISELTNNKVVGIIFIVFVSVGVDIWILGSMLSAVNLEWISEYFISNLLIIIPTQFNSDTVLKLVTTSSAYIVISTIISIYYINKKDIH